MSARHTTAGLYCRLSQVAINTHCFMISHMTHACVSEQSHSAPVFLTGAMEYHAAYIHRWRMVWLTHQWYSPSFHAPVYRGHIVGLQREFKVNLLII